MVNSVQGYLSLVEQAAHTGILKFTSNQSSCNMFPFRKSGNYHVSHAILPNELPFPFSFRVTPTVTVAPYQLPSAIVWRVI